MQTESYIGQTYCPVKDKTLSTEEPLTPSRVDPRCPGKYLGLTAYTLGNLMKCVKMTLIMLFKVLLITSPMGCNGTQENNQTKTSRMQPL